MVTCMQDLYYEYHFISRNLDAERVIRVDIDPGTLNRIVDPPKSLPSWTCLNTHQCSNCPLNNETHKCCPVATNLVELVDCCDEFMSHDNINIEVCMPERTVTRETSMQRGVSSLLGLLIATSGCPHTEFLKPMARFHLPFSTIEETTVRTASMYLLAQYFRYKNQPGMRFDFKTLEKHYLRVQQVNEGLLKRINKVNSEDADKNAIITLHSLSQFLSMEIDYSLGGLESIFAGRYSD